jgi:hypothetical protein
MNVWVGPKGGDLADLWIPQPAGVQLLRSRMPVESSARVGGTLAG